MTQRSVGLAAALAAFALLLLLGAQPGRAIDYQDTRLLSQPAVSDTHIAFTYAGDLWLADRSGRNVRRLTSHPGDESSPRFSPDGSKLAFSGEYDGNLDVYLVDVSGGSPERLTWHPGSDIVQGFTHDGSAVLFASRRSVFTNRLIRLFTVPLTGGFPTELPIPTGYRASMSGDGSKIAYVPNIEAFNQWKNYRGGTTSRIWIYQTADHSVVEIPQPEGRSNDTDPVFIGQSVWFRSDRNGEFNLYSYDTASKKVSQHTQFEDFPILRVTGSRDTLIYEQNGYLHLFDPSSGDSNRLQIGVIDDLDETRVRWIDGPRWIRNADLSPDGQRAVFEYRGEIVTLPAKKGDLRNLSRSTGANDRSPVWSPDGSKIAWFSDESGEYQLIVAPQNGQGAKKSYELGGNGFYEEPLWSPDSGKLAFIDNSWTLYVLDLESGKVQSVATEPHFGPPPVRGLGHAWSPDSKWLVYTQNTQASIETVHLYDTESDTSHQVTDGLSDARSPVFDRSGKYIYFLASTDAGPVKHWFAMSNADMERSSSVYVAVLAKDTPSPLAAENDEVEVSDAGDDGKDESAGSESPESGDDKADNKDAAKESSPVTIDFAGLDQRILALPIDDADYPRLQAGEDGKIYYLRPGDDGGQIVQFDLASREETTLLEGAQDFTVSANGKKLLYVAGNSWGIASAGGSIDRGETALPIDKLRMRVDPVAEWQQIFKEVWRINRDYFYDPNMHGADWTAMGEKYSLFLPHVTNRDDLNRVMMWMCSELAVGHHRVGFGDDPVEAESVPGGLLGADFEIEGGRYRFKKIFGGLNWNPEMRSPLTEPGVSVEEGEYLLAVDGVDLSGSDNLYSRFEHTAETIVELTIGQDSSGKDTRTVQAVPITNESALRNRDWVEGNIKKVHQATDGRVAYVYVPNTTQQGHVYFKRYFFPQADKDAIIVDERFNGGGQVADYYIDHLRRPFISNWATRYGQDISTPSASIQGPKVMLIDETAGSGGDLLPWMFRKLNLGPLIGKRTWGGLVGTLGFPPLIDGGFVTAPNLAIWTEDGFVVENVGVPPDIEVEQWPAEVMAGHDPQLEKAIEVILEELRANPPVKTDRPPFPIRVRE